MFLIRTLRAAARVTLAVLLALMAVVVTGHNASAQNAATGPNSNPTYQALRNLTLGSESVGVNNLELKRDAGTFHLRSGTVCFVNSVEGKVTGAVFLGDGNFILNPPASERSMLKLLTKEDEFSENFNQMVLRFTDSSYDDIKKGGSVVTSGCDAGPLKDSQHVMRHKLKSNLDSRILEDVLSPEPGGLFIAFIHGKRYNGQELYTIDPHEGRDQVDFMTYDENKFGDWASFPTSGERKPGMIGQPIRIEHQQLDTTLEKNANLIGKSKTTFTANLNGTRVVPLNLFRTLRVRSVTTGDGQPLSFIQEDKNDDAQFAVILPKTLAAGEPFTIATEYEGKEAVTNEGGGNYLPIARENWYPSNPGSGFGEYATYDMTFRIPKGMQIAATGCNRSPIRKRQVGYRSCSTPLRGTRTAREGACSARCMTRLKSRWAPWAPWAPPVSIRKPWPKDNWPCNFIPITSACLPSSTCKSRSKIVADKARRGRSWCGFRSAITSTPPCAINLGWTGATADTGRL